MKTNRTYLLAIAALLLPATFAFAEGSVDASTATKISLPAAGETPVAFKTPDGKEGWIRKLSNETIPTPAFHKGRIFTGTGMGGHVFLALDAATGKTVWQKPTTDNGPTSPIVANGYVAYNTESCDTESRDEDSGEMVWHETTGGSLLTQPVVANTMLIIPHPTMQRKAVMADDAFRMLAVDLKTGKHAWDRNMTADVLGAPVAVGNTVYFTCTDGRLFCVPAVDDLPGWHVVANATSAPVVVGKTVAVTTEDKKAMSTVVSLRRYSTETGELLDNDGIAATKVAAPILAKTQRAEWDYQGPKIAATANAFYFAPGQTVNSIDVGSGKVNWQTRVVGGGVSNAANALTPPALGKDNVYLGSAKGHILALKKSDGSLAFAYNIGQQMASQPILAEGNLYVGTANGYLVCIKLQNPDADNWTAWGGNAQHNKVD